jgi:hypothetical protein
MLLCVRLLSERWHKMQHGCILHQQQLSVSN